MPYNFPHIREMKDFIEIRCIYQMMIIRLF